MPIIFFILDFPFSKWGLDFMDLISPPSTISGFFILTTTNYFAKWSKVVPLKNSKDKLVISFLEVNILSSFIIGDHL
jgi:hypothetical protein